MVFLRRRGKKFKAIRFYDADFYNVTHTNLKKKFHEKFLFFVRQSKRFTWRVSSKINPYKLRKRKRSPRSLKFLSKQQLKYFLGNLKEYQFRFLYRRVIGYKRANLRKSFLSSLVRFFEGRLDSFLFKYLLAKPFNIQNVLFDNVFSLNDGNSFLKRNFLLSTGDRYSLSSFYAFKFYLERNLNEISFFKKKRKKLGRRRSLFVGRWKLKLFRKKRRFIFRVLKKKQRKMIGRLFSFTFKNVFSLSRVFNYLRPQFFLFKRARFLSVFSNFNFGWRKRIFKLRKYRKIPVVRLFLKRLFLFNILKFRRFFFYKFFKINKRKKRRFFRFFSRVLPFKPWSLFMKWRVGYLLPDPFLRLVFFLEQPSNPKDMLFSFSFNVRNLLFVYQSIK